MDLLGLPLETSTPLGVTARPITGCRSTQRRSSNGQPVADARDLRVHGRREPDVAQCLVRKFYAYAMGHAERVVDGSVLNALATSLRSVRFQLRDLVARHRDPRSLFVRRSATLIARCHAMTIKHPGPTDRAARHARDRRRRHRPAATARGHAEWERHCARSNEYAAVTPLRDLVLRQRHAAGPLEAGENGRRPAWELSPQLQPLADSSRHLTVITGLEDKFVTGGVSTQLARPAATTGRRSTATRCARPRSTRSWRM